MVKIEGKIRRWGHSYGIIISKELVDADVFKENQVVVLELKELKGIIQNKNKSAVITNDAINPDDAVIWIVPGNQQQGLFVNFPETHQKAL